MREVLSKLLAGLAAVALIFALTGCESLLERQFVDYSRHMDATEASGSVSSVRISDARALETMLLEAILTGASELTVQLTDYAGDVERDVQDVRRRLRIEEPICNWAVDTIDYQSVKILTYYEIRFDISYRRSTAQMAAIRTVRSEADFEAYILEMLLAFDGQLAMNISNYSAQRYDAAAMVARLTDTNPMAAYGLTGVTVSLHPEKGIRRILEIQLQYNESAAVLREKSESAGHSAANIAAAVQRETGPRAGRDEMALALHDFLCGHVTFDETAAAYAAAGTKEGRRDAQTAYGALTLSRASPEGYAMAFQLLCEEAGIPSQVVQGRLGNTPHAWNLVRLSDGGWVHIDCALDDLDDIEGAPGVGYRFYGLTDSEIALTHQWDSSLYPAAAGTAGRALLPEDSAALRSSRYPDPSPPDAAVNPPSVDVESGDLPGAVTRPSTAASGGTGSGTTTAHDSKTGETGTSSEDPPPVTSSAATEPTETSVSSETAAAP